MTAAWALFAAVFLASAVEAVEATTIVLAVGTTRDWGAALRGVGASLLLLAGVVAGLGPALTTIPFAALRVVVGGLLLIFGLQWLRKAVLRAGGVLARHDETRIYQSEEAAARAAAKDVRLGIGDWYAFTIAFKGVTLEGLEVAFIALTLGTNAHDLPLASAAALAAVAVVAAAGVAVRAPLARMPENTTKFVVGVMLCSFGSFWGGEGAGVHWPGGDAALLILAPAIGMYALGLVVVVRRMQHRTTGDRSAPADVVGR
jgi:uncharacterized membrane protein